MRQLNAPIFLLLGAQREVIDSNQKSFPGNPATKKTGGLVCHQKHQAFENIETLISKITSY
ncbi:MAG: hypothetical protein IIA70_09140 [Proteobacteria bacterium]|nr:hypothetical protein [Pseudomonadota bacterium]